jgi:thiol-disulfide isomerase/thioredoxin
MKKETTRKPNCFFLIALIIIISGCAEKSNTSKYLGKVLKNLEKIESATYYSTKEAYAPGDTIPNVRMIHFVKAYDNPIDTTIGASYVNLLPEDTTQLISLYDGKMLESIYREDNEIVIDYFDTRKLPFRPLPPPFFNHVESIIRYAMETNDSISIKIEESTESVYFCVTIFEDQQVEFFGKAYHLEIPPFEIDPTSKFEIWIDKSTDLPYMVRRVMDHQTSTESVADVSLNRQKIEDLDISNYEVPDFPIHVVGSKKSNPAKVNDLVSMVAPDWILQDAVANNVGLNDLKSKVIMIQFTSVTCGPCHASIPFLNQLTSDYNKEDLEFVAIECTANSLDALKRYQDKNSISYRLLFSTEDVRKDYSISSYPVFFILDENRIVKDVITGYGEGKTDDIIKSAINELI